uniref:Odorant binding protein 4 n=1 Tax=Pachypeltis micranthus TaxID=1983339 RepID=A0A1W6QYM8_9HEMI|nr:odorant binding protein 4 [Pachypeltis micranthus]
MVSVEILKYSFWLVVALVGCFIACKAEPKGLSEEQKEAFLKALKQCQQDSGLQDAEYDSMIKDKQPPQSKEGKCFVKCILEANEVIVNGEVNKVGVEASLEEAIEDQSKLKEAKEILKGCTESVKPGEDDECEFATKLANCLYGKMKESNIQGPMS